MRILEGNKLEIEKTEENLRVLRGVGHIEEETTYIVDWEDIDIPLVVFKEFCDKYKLTFSEIFQQLAVYGDYYLFETTDITKVGWEVAHWEERLEDFIADYLDKDKLESISKILAKAYTKIGYTKEEAEVIVQNEYTNSLGWIQKNEDKLINFSKIGEYFLMEHSFVTCNGNIYATFINTELYN